jgi:glycosyltransferase involved in cell wall biosynthesis
MKVLHIVAGGLSGGAARGAYWLHLGLKDLGVESVVFTNTNSTNSDPDVYVSEGRKISKVLGFFRRQVDKLATAFYPRKIKRIFSTGFVGVDFTKHEKYKDADIVHLHWINAGFVNVKDLAKVDKPMIWTLRDMWPMTGGCHYSMECEGYQKGCGKCPQLGSHFTNDLSRIVWKRKKRAVPASLKLVGISAWLTDRTRESSLFRGYDVRTISNNIDSGEFFPVDKCLAKKLLGIATEKKIILAGANSAKDFYKGFDKYVSALSFLNAEDYYLCFFGRLDESAVKDLGFEFHCFGTTRDNISLRTIYSCADVFAAPSIMEAFGKTLAEAMACGTPVVCFDATGPRDIVSHKVDGYKATPFEPESLAEGITWVANAANYPELTSNARRKVLERFDSKVVAEQYLQLYTEILAGAPVVHAETL